MTSQLDQWKALSASVDAGELRLEPGVARQCAARCQRHVDELNDLMDRARLLSKTEGYGDLPSAQQLGEKFKRLAVGGGPYYDLVQLLQDRIAVARQMESTFNKIHQRYQQTETQNVDRLQRAGDGL